MVRAACWFVALLSSFTFLAHEVQACPTVNQLIDYNCDRKVTYVFIGDSVVFGRGDSRFGNKGGYVRRLRSTFPNVTVVNLGKPGYTTAQLYSWFKRQYSRSSTSVHQAAKNADAVFIDVGRNDFFDEVAPAMTQRNVRRLADYLRNNLGKELDVKPIISIATLLPTKGRPIQQLFVTEVNGEFLKRNGANFPVKLRFDRLPASFIDISGVHPRSQGYDRLASTLRSYVRGSLQSRAARADVDADGVYDFFEANRFGTSPALADTDGDTLWDGTELFQLMTDPLVPNS